MLRLIQLLSERLRKTQSAEEVRPQGLKPALLLHAFAALKGRSSPRGLFHGDSAFAPVCADC